MATAFYLTHPQVFVDSGVPVKQWRLSEVGRARAEAVARASWTAGVRRIVASAERKTTETAAIFAASRGIGFESDAIFNENNREATGYLALADFDIVVDAFFAHPEQSARGWERALDAQKRVVSAVGSVLDTSASGDVLFIGHGAVGTLLLCHIAHWTIARERDQPAGGGNLFAFDIPTRQVMFGWRPAEADLPL